MQKLTRALMAVVMMTAIAVAQPALASADDPSALQLTLQQAVQMALNNSQAVKSAQVGIGIAYDYRKQAVNDTHWMPTTSAAPPNAIIAFGGLLNADRNWVKAQEGYAAAKDQVTGQVITAYNNILVDLQKEKLAQEQVVQDQRQLTVTRAMLAWGVVPEISVDQIETKLHGDQKNLDAVQKQMAGDYETFNILIGLNPQSRPVLTDQVAPFAKFDEGSLELVVDRVMANSHQIKMAQADTDIAKNQRALNGVFDAGQLSYEQAMNNQQNTENQVESQVRSMYYGIKALEDQYQAAQKALALAEKNLAIAKVNYQAGVITKVQMDDSQVAYDQQRTQVLELAAQHDNLVKQLQIMMGEQPVDETVDNNMDYVK